LREDADVTDADAMRLAVLIDSDNTTASLTTELLEEIAKYGTPTVKRAYGDWTTPHDGSRAICRAFPLASSPCAKSYPRARGSSPSSGIGSCCKSLRFSLHGHAK
jgi:hypothetical protein